MKRLTSLLIVPECSAPGCHNSGDHHTMVKCRGCGHWFCEAHLATAPSTAPETENATSEPGARIAQVPTIKLVNTGAHDLSYYLGYCPACLDAQLGAQAARSPVDSHWLR